MGDNNKSKLDKFISDNAVYFDRRTGKTHTKAESKLNRFCLEISQSTYPVFTRMSADSQSGYVGYRLNNKLMAVI